MALRGCGARVLPRRRPAPAQRAGPHPRPRATTSRHTRNGRSAASHTTSEPIAAPGQAAARSPAAASSSTPAVHPAERPTRPVTVCGLAPPGTAHEPATRARFAVRRRLARGAGLASDRYGAADAMTMPCALTCPNHIPAEPRGGSDPALSDFQYERNSRTLTTRAQRSFGPPSWHIPPSGPVTSRDHAGQSLSLLL